MPITMTTSDYNTVTSASQELPIAMVPGNQYVLRSSVACYFKIGATGATTASAADNSHYLGADAPAFISALDNTSKYVAVIRVGSTDGVCTLSLMAPGANQ